MSEVLGTWAGMRVIINDAAFPKFREDWSGVRSPARARRRRKLGFPQRIKFVKNNNPAAYRFGDTLIVNTEMARALLERSSK